LARTSVTQHRGVLTIDRDYVESEGVGVDAGTSARPVLKNTFAGEE
jgi:hypothetical protein